MDKWELDNPFNVELYNHIVYEITLEAAKRASPTPSQSEYYVNTAGITKSGVEFITALATGGIFSQWESKGILEKEISDLIDELIRQNKLFVQGNHEYSINRAGHGEEDVLLASLQGAKGDPISIIAFAGKYGDIPRSCGNCRDIEFEHASPNLQIVSGVYKGGQATVIPIELYKHNNFAPLSLDEIVAKGVSGISPERLMAGIKKAAWAKRISYDAYVTDTLKEAVYGASIFSANGMIFCGGFIGYCDFHPSLPGGNAIANLYFGNENPERFNVEALVIVGNEHPDIIYRDRQHIKEFAEGVSIAKGKTGEALPIYIFQIDDNGNPLKGYMTNTNEFLPYAFSPLRFGMGEMVGKTIKKAL